MDKGKILDLAFQTKLYSKLRDKLDDKQKLLEEKVVELVDQRAVKGDKGDKGDQGPAGRDGLDGLNGINGKDGIDGKNGKDGKDGKPGKNGKDGIDGKDGSPDTPEQVRDKLETLKGDKRLDAKAIKNLDKFVSNKITFAGGLPAGPLGDITSVVAGTGISGGGTSGDVTVSLDTSYADSRYVNTSGDTMTGNLSLGANQLTAHNIRPDGSDGLLIESNNGTDVALFGAGGGANATFYDGVKLDGGTASRVLTTDSSKNVAYATMTSTELDDLLRWKVDTRANIQALSPSVNTIALTTDTYEIALYYSGAWYFNPLKLLVRPGNGIDQGWTQDNSMIGIDTDWISQKTLSDVYIGSNVDTTNASATRIPLRASGGTLQIYVSGSWQTIVSNFVFSEDSSYGYALKHQPVGFTRYIEVMTGNSINDLGLNGYPLTHAYTNDQGPYPSPDGVGGFDYSILLN